MYAGRVGGRGGREWAYGGRTEGVQTKYYGQGVGVLWVYRWRTVSKEAKQGERQSECGLAKRCPASLHLPDLTEIISRPENPHTIPEP